MAGLLHVVCAGLRPDADVDRRAGARALAVGLRAAPAARAVLVAESATHLLVATWLEGRDALEGFAASPEHMAFIMRGVAQVTSGMWSAAVETEAEAPLEAEALFVFGLRAATDGPQLYEWQVRALLEQLGRLPGAVAAGLTFEERDRFRAAGAVAVPPGGTAAFEATRATVEGAWRAALPVSELADSLVTAFAPVVGMASHEP